MHRVGVDEVAIAAVLGDRGFWADIPGQNPFLVIVGPTVTDASWVAAGDTVGVPTAEAFDALAARVAANEAALAELEVRLGRQRYLVADRITEADWRLFPTLVRFDVAYFSLFRCNRNRIADYPNLSRFMRDLYRVPGIAQTVKPRYYVIGYWSIAKLNPSGIIPKGTPVDYGA